MSFAHVCDSPVRLANKVGILIKLTCAETKAMHVGLAFETGGIVRIAHLAWQDKLVSNPIQMTSGYAWSDCQWLQDPDLASTAEYIALFIKGSLRDEKVDYGLEPDLDSFATGQFVSRDPVHGLTCATYIAAVLRAAGVDVVDITTWQHRDEDDVWADRTLELLREHAPARAAALEGQRARFRVRPDEMAFATASPTVPVSFDVAVAGSADVRTILLNGPIRPGPAE